MSRSSLIAKPSIAATKADWPTASNRACTKEARPLYVIYVHQWTDKDGNKRSNRWCAYRTSSTWIPGPMAAVAAASAVINGPRAVDQAQLRIRAGGGGGYDEPSHDPEGFCGFSPLPMKKFRFDLFPHGCGL